MEDKVMSKEYSHFSVLLNESIDALNIKKDGIYLYREVSMGRYELEKSLDCEDMSACFLVLCADVLTGMRCKKMISTDELDYQTILKIMRNNKDCVLNSISDSSNFLVERFNYLIKVCADDNHHFADLKHFNGGSECRCKKCGFVVKFNRGWSERIDQCEKDDFLQKYNGSKIDF